MISRWSDRLLRVLSAQFRRGALFVLAILTSVTLTLSPVLSSPTGAQANFTSLLGAAGALTEGTSSCAIDMVGWVICPTMRTIAKLADYGWTYVNQNFLEIDYSIASASSGTYTAWQLMRNIANALFVVAFMILIYSQLTGRGGTYNIKRLLPKLIISAFLVNVSYWICVGIIDVSNILGNSLLAIFKGVASKVGTEILPIGASPSAGTDGALTVITSAVLGKTGTVWVLLAPVAAVIISIATICSFGVVLLIMRKTMIAMLILFSPILFVAYLLPNLEKYFQQGVRIFVQLLMLYPIIAILLGAGQIVSATIVTVGSNDANYRVSGDSYLPRNGGSGSAITDTTAAAAAVVPLLAVWFIFKNMNSLMSTAGSRLSASIAGRRGGGKNDEKAKVTGNAVTGAANNLAKGLGGPFNRRQAYSRNRRRSSLSGSALNNENRPAPATDPSKANRQPTGAAAQNALQNSIQGQGEDSKKQLEELNDARLSGKADDLDIENAMTDAIAAGNAKAEENKKLTAKDLFNNLNKSHDHESKDKDRKFSSGPAPAGSGGGEGEGSKQPTAPSTSYRAPQMAQSGNIISGSSAPQQPTKIIAVPVQIDASTLLNNQQNRQLHPPDNVTQPPISGTEEKAKARAQKYLYDSQRDIDDAREKMEILGHKDTPAEPPHTKADDKSKEDDD